MADAGERAREKRAYERRDYLTKVRAVLRVCRRLEAGENLTQICRDPTMPPRSTVVSWRERHPELREKLEQAEVLAAKVHPPRRDYHHFDEAVTAEFLARIEDGRGLQEVCAETDMPAHSSITRWLNERPAFARAYARAREAQSDRLFDLAWRIACEAEEAEWHVAKLKIDTIKFRIGRLVPRKYGPWRLVEEAQKPAVAREKVSFEIRQFAVAPGGKVKDITVQARGLDQEGVERLCDDVEAGRVVIPDEPPLAPDEHIGGSMLFRVTEEDAD